MSLERVSVEKRLDFNLTSLSTVHRLVGVCLTCALLWGVIAATIAS